MQSTPPTDRNVDRAAAARESTASLLAGARQGDPGATNRLLVRFLPRLTRWAHGRLPASARSPADTKDLVHLALLRAFTRLEAFEPRREGAFLAYLCQILLNEIRQAPRREARRPTQRPLPDDIADPGPSPLELVVGRETFAAYEAGLVQLTDDQREAVLLRVEMGLTYQEVADAMESPSPDAARMLVVRGLARLGELMDERQ